MSHDKLYLQKQALHFISDKLASERLSDNNREIWLMIRARLQVAEPSNGEIVTLLLGALPEYRWD